MPQKSPQLSQLRSSKYLSRLNQCKMTINTLIKFDNIVTSLLPQYLIRARSGNARITVPLTFSVEHFSQGHAQILENGVVKQFDV